MATKSGKGNVLQGPELFFGLVSPVGTDLKHVIEALTDALQAVEYKSSPVHLSDLLAEIPKWKDVPRSGQAPEDVRIDALMTKGTEFRERLERGAALAIYATHAIRDDREEISGDPNVPAQRRAYILRSLKHPDEATALKQIYGVAFILIAVYSPRHKRVDHLARRISESRHDPGAAGARAEAERLVQRDEAEPGRPLGQNVRGVFPMADVFIDGSEPSKARQDITRFVESLFGHPFHTPGRDEFGMFQAHAAALRSSDMGRQVGAAIATTEGDIVAIGCNDVPKIGGGQYWTGDNPDGRDFRLGVDLNRRRLEMILADMLRRLSDAKWLTKERRKTNLDDLVEEALYKKPAPIMTGAQLLSIIEFFRAVHAEMAAITDAAKRGVSVKGCTLYSTTFPCHDCAKHIVAAGLGRVVYIHPYPKSLVAELYTDSIQVDRGGGGGREVRFESFVGIGPSKYTDLFTATERKTQQGMAIQWDGRGKRPRLEGSPASYLLHEEAEFRKLKTLMLKKHLVPS